MKGSDDCFEKLLKVSEDIPDLHEVLKYISTHCESHECSKPGPFSPLLNAICRDFPISALLLPAAVGGDDEDHTVLMKAVKGGLGDVTSKQTLLAHFPVLGELASVCKWEVIPDPIQALVLGLQKSARVPLSLIQNHECVEVSDYESHVTFAAENLKLCRWPESYRADGPGQDTKRDEVPCNKYTDSHVGLTPGIFGIFCPHGFCLAFNIMSRCEGPKTFFDLIYHRFKKGEHNLRKGK